MNPRVSCTFVGTGEHAAYFVPCTAWGDIRGINIYCTAYCVLCTVYCVQPSLGWPEGERHIRPPWRRIRNICMLSNNTGRQGAIGQRPDPVTPTRPCPSSNLMRHERTPCYMVHRRAWADDMRRNGRFKEMLRLLFATAPFRHLRCVGSSFLRLHILSKGQDIEKVFC